MAVLQEIVKRLCSIRGAELDLDRWFQNWAPVVDTPENVADTTENEAPWTMMTCRKQSSTLVSTLQHHDRKQIGSSTAIDTYKQGLQGETAAACGGHHNKKQRLLVAGVSLLKGTEAPTYCPDRES